MSTSEGAGAEGTVQTPAEAPAERPDPADAAASLTVLDELDGRPLHEHVAVYDELHARLQSALNRIDEA